MHSVQRTAIKRNISLCFGSSGLSVSGNICTDVFNTKRCSLVGIDAKLSYYRAAIDLNQTMTMSSGTQRQGSESHVYLAWHRR